MKPVYYTIREGGQWIEWPKIVRLPPDSDLLEFCRRSGVFALKFSDEEGSWPIFDRVVGWRNEKISAIELAGV